MDKRKRRCCKPCLDRATLALSRIESYPELEYDGTNVYCTICKMNIEFEKQHLFDQHINSVQHKSTDNTPNLEDFNMDLVKVLLTSDISLNCLNNSEFRGFLEKYCIGGNNLPDGMTLQTDYVQKVFEHSFNKIRDELKDSYLWITVGALIDATTDGQFVVSVIVRKLNSNAPCGRPYLISCKLLNEINPDSIIEIVKTSLEKLWNDSYENNKDKPLFLLTDPKSYMMDAGKILKTQFPNLIYCTCLVNGLNEIVEDIRGDYSNVDKLIVDVKRFFTKVPSRRKIYRQRFETVPLPPDVKTTKWKMWINSCLYYEQYIDGLHALISNMDLKKSRDIFQNYEQLKEKLVFIKNNFSIFSTTVQKLKSKNLTIQESLNNLQNVHNNLELITDNIGGRVRQKFNSIFQENPNFNLMSRICNAMLNTNSVDVSKELGVSAVVLEYLKYAILVTSDMEHLFLYFKSFVHKKRVPLTNECLERMMLAYNDKNCD